jgi:hypothetical protein
MPEGLDVVYLQPRLHTFGPLHPFYVRPRCSNPMFSKDAVLLTAKKASMKAGNCLGSDTSVGLQVLKTFTTDYTGAILRNLLSGGGFPPLVKPSS